MRCASGPGKGRSVNTPARSRSEAMRTGALRCSLVWSATSTERRARLTIRRLTPTSWGS